MEAGFALTLGNVYTDLARFSEAEKEFNICARIAIERGQTNLEAAAITGTATVDMYRGILFKALEGYRRALHIYDRTRNNNGAANANLNIGNILELYEQPTDAVLHLRAAAKYFTTASTPLDRANFKLITGNYILAEGGDTRLMQALGVFTEARDLYHAVPNSIGEARSLIAIGNVLRDQGNRQQVLRRQGGKYVDPETGLLIKDIEYYARALALGEKAGLRLVQVVALAALGQAYGDSNNWSKAIGYYEDSLKLSDAIGALGARVVALDSLSNANMITGNKREAVVYGKQAVEVATETGDPYLQGKAHEELAHVFGALPDESSARAELDQAVLFYARSGSQRSEQRVRDLIAQIHRQQ